MNSSKPTLSQPIYTNTSKLYLQLTNVECQEMKQNSLFIPLELLSFGIHLSMVYVWENIKKEDWDLGRWETYCTI